MKPAQQGFTLIEELVAVATLALAMSVFLSGASQYADNARYMQQRSLATWVASNRLVEMQLIEPWPDEGVDEGSAENGGQYWLWRSEVSESPDPNLRKVEVSVYPAQGENDSLDDDANSVARLVAYLSPNGGSNSTSGEGARNPASGSGDAAGSVIRNNFPEGFQP